MKHLIMLVIFVSLIVGGEKAFKKNNGDVNLNSLTTLPTNL